MDDNKLIFDGLEQRVFSLLSAHVALQEKNISLEEELELAKVKIKELKIQQNTLVEENNSIKIINGLSGNQEHRRLMKLKLSKLVKEVDTCIAQLKNQ